MVTFLGRGGHRFVKCYNGPILDMDHAIMGYGPIFDPAHLNFGPYRNLAHVGPLLRKKW